MRTLIMVIGWTYLLFITAGCGSDSETTAHRNVNNHDGDMSVDTGSHGSIDADTDTDTDADTDTDTDTDAAMDTNADADTDTDTDTGGSTDTGIGTEADTDATADTDTNINMNTDTDSDTDTDGDTALASDTCFVETDGPGSPCILWQRCHNISGDILYFDETDNHCEAWGFAENDCLATDYAKTVCEDFNSPNARCSTTSLDRVSGCAPTTSDPQKACLPENHCTALLPAQEAERWDITVFTTPINQSGLPDGMNCEAAIHSNTTLYYQCFMLGTADAECRIDAWVNCD